MIVGGGPAGLATAIMLAAAGGKKLTKAQLMDAMLAMDKGIRQQWQVLNCGVALV